MGEIKARFRILQSESMEELEESVNKHLKDGWHVHRNETLILDCEIYKVYVRAVIRD